MMFFFVGGAAGAGVGIYGGHGTTTRKKLYFTRPARSFTPWGLCVFCFYPHICSIKRRRFHECGAFIKIIF